MPNLVTLQRPEFIGDITFTANSDATLPTRGGVLPSDLFYYGLLVEVEGRLVIGVAAGDAVRADSPFSLVERVQVQGLHRIRRQQELFYDLRGAEVRELGRHYLSRAPISDGAPTVGPATFDFRFYLPIIFPPEKIPLVQQAAYLLDAPNYDNLVLRVRWGDAFSMIDPAATTTLTLSAFGAGTGSPRARVMAIFATFGRDGAPGFVPARVWRYFEENVVDLTTTADQRRLFNINRGHTIRSLQLKTGTKATAAQGITAGNNAYQTLSNVLVDDVKVMRGTNKQIRHYQDYRSLQEYSAEQVAITPTDGYSVIDFAEAGDVLTALDTQGLVAGPTGDVDLFLQADSIAGAANQAAILVTQEVRGVPVGLGR